MIPIGGFEERRVAVFGLGLSGVAAARALRAGGAQVAVWDDSEAGLAKAAAAGFEPVDLRAADWRGLAALVLAPGVPLTHPEPHWTVGRAREAGVEVIGDTELFCRERRRLKSRARIAAITGTNGKSTTTALTAHLLARAGRRTAMGGNIGTPILELPPFVDDLHYVIEYSSYQIDLTPTLDATAACLLNVTPDHIDRHGSFENYAAVKARIFSRLGAGDTAAIGVDGETARGIADALRTRAALRRISVAGPVEDGVYVREGVLIEVVDGAAQPPVSLAGVGSLRGAHNWQNAAAAFALARGMGLSREEIAPGLASFPGLEHRMQEIARIGRVLFVNDSKATNADAAGKALACFEDIHWIVGGRAKQGGLDGLEPYFSRIRKAYLIGEAEADFARALAGLAPCERCGHMEAAVAAAARDAAASPAREPVVLLSPACASFDQYPNFMARGEHFTAIVRRLAGLDERGAA